MRLYGWTSEVAEVEVAEAAAGRMEASSWLEKDVDAQVVATAGDMP